MSTVLSKLQLKVADEAWIIAALLHREQPGKVDFSVEEIMQRAQKERLTERLRPGVYVHIIQHCVANRRPNPGRYRMLFETAPGRRRLFRLGDPYHPERQGGKVTPDRDDLHGQFGELLDWYREWSSSGIRAARESDPLLALRGSGKRLWANESADQYVRRLREGWE
jgi:hypothetical protein